MGWGNRKIRGHISSDFHTGGSDRGTVFVDLSPLLKTATADDVDHIVDFLSSHRSNFTDALIGEIYRMRSEGLFTIPPDERNYVVIQIPFTFFRLPISKMGHVLVQSAEDVVNHVHWVLCMVAELRHFDVKVVSCFGSRSTLNANPAPDSPLRNLPVLGHDDKVSVMQSEI